MLEPSRDTRTSIALLPIALVSIAIFMLPRAVASEGDAARDGEDLFATTIAALLEERCLACHDDVHQKGGLTLARREGLLAGGESGPAVRAGSPERSLLIEKVTPHEGKAAMPRLGEPLSPAQIETLRAWIAAGLEWPAGRVLAARGDDASWWSWRELARPARPAPRAGAARWARTPIDEFIAAAHAERGLEPVPEADRVTLIRRLHYDLVGLPPPPEEVDAFVADDDPRAYDRLVDRLLASPHYGERWARHWLDVVHYADTHGYDKDKLRGNAWPYRDYVIRSLNDDKPYGRFVREQVAGDVLYPESPDGIVATGFIAAGPWDFIGHVEVPETKFDGQVARNLDRDDMVSTTLNTFTSVTVQCARCHDHKFDPVSQEHYYGLQAVFAALDRTDRPYDLDPAVARRRHELEERRAELAARAAAIERQIDERKSEEVRTLEQELLALDGRSTAAGQVEGEERSPAFGYHSQVAAAPDTVKWVQVDLGREVELDAVVLFGADEYGWSDFGFPARFRLEAGVAADLSDARELANYTDGDFPRPGATPVVLETDGKRARYVRVTATRLWERRRRGEEGSGDWIFALGELLALSAGRTVPATEVSALDSIEALPRWGKACLTDRICGTYALEDVLAAAGASSPTNGFHSTFAAAAETTRWVEIDLGEPRAISRVVLHGAYPTDWPDTPGFGFPLRFRVETSLTPTFESPGVLLDSGEGMFPDPGHRPVVVAGGGARGRYVRVSATRLRDRGEGMFALALAEVTVESDGAVVSRGKEVTASDSIDQGRWHRRALTDGFTSRRRLDDEGELLARLAAPRAEESAEANDERRELVAAIERGIRASVGEETLSRRARVADEAAQVEAEIATLPEPQLVYTATVHHGSGAFRGRGGLGPRAIHVLARGDLNALGAEAPPGTIPVIAGEETTFELPPGHAEGARRAALARWLTDERNPLAWRSIVNRVWLYHFGRGIVDSPNDFGRMGQKPTHPELLDWLAIEFRDGGESIAVPQSLKELHRLIVSSSVYRLSSEDEAENAAVDGDNAFYWRMQRRRLEAEAIRDTVLAVSGKLDRTMYGPGFRDFVLEQPEHSPHYKYEKHDPEDPTAHRRAVYRFLVRSQQQPFMETLDCADPSQNVAKRNETLSALQALALLNNKFMLCMASHFADRLTRERDGLEAQIRHAYRLLVSRAPDGAELEALVAYAREFGLANLCRVLFNLNEFVFVD